jgi:transposase-like protein
MIDFAITELLDDSLSLMWLEQHLHPDGLQCPRCGSTARRLFRDQGHFPAYRCQACDDYYTLLTGTVFAKTRQRPATLVLLLRGIAKGEPTARLARELGLSRKQLHTLRERIQTNLNATAPTDMMMGTTLEADALYQNAGENKHASSRSHRSTPPACQYAQRARHLCQRSSPHHQCDLARDGRAALVGLRPREQADLPHPHGGQRAPW